MQDTQPDETTDEGSDGRQIRRTLVIAMLLLGWVVGASAAGLVATSPLPDGSGYPVSGGVYYETNTGLTVIVGSGTNMASGNRFPNDATFEFYTTDGNVTLTSSGPATVQVLEPTGPMTKLGTLDVSNSAVTINPEDKRAVTVQGETTALSFGTMELDDQTVDFAYRGPSGETTITVRGLPTDTSVQAVDDTTTEILDVAETDANGVATFALPNSEHDVTLQQGGDIRNVANYYGNETTEVDNESWTTDHREPTLANWTHYITRIGSFVVGDGGDAQGGGSANALIIGLLFLGAFVGVAVRGQVGTVAGAVLGVIGIAGLVATAVVPGWLYPVVLFILGAVLSVVAIRLWR